MKIVKKISGICLFLFAIILSFATLVAFLRAVLDSVKEFKIDVSGGIGYIFGSLIIIVLLIIIVRYMFKWSLKLIKTKAEPEDSIDQIGLEE